MAWLVIGLIILIGICKGVDNTLRFYYYDSVFSLFKTHSYWWWRFNIDSVMSRVKYKDYDDVKKIPRLFGSTTFFVWLNFDGFHFPGLIRRLCYYSIFYIMYKYQINISDIEFILCLVAMYCIQTSTFVAFYNYLLTKKFWGIK